MSKNQINAVTVMAELGVQMPRRLRPFLILAALAALWACKPESTAELKKTIAEARTKPRVNVQIRLETSDFPSPDELALRQKLESDIESRHIGAVLDSGSGNGYMDFTVEVEDTPTSIPRIQSLLNDAGVSKRSTIRVVSP
jgi:hypothetical protein